VAENARISSPKPLSRTTKSAANESLNSPTIDRSLCHNKSKIKKKDNTTKMYDQEMNDVSDVEEEQQEQQEETNQSSSEGNYSNKPTAIYLATTSSGRGAIKDACARHFGYNNFQRMKFDIQQQDLLEYGAEVYPLVMILITPKTHEELSQAGIHGRKPAHVNNRPLQVPGEQNHGTSSVPRILLHVNKEKEVFVASFACPTHRYDQQVTMTSTEIRTRLGFNDLRGANILTGRTLGSNIHIHALYFNENVLYRDFERINGGIHFHATDPFVRGQVFKWTFVNDNGRITVRNVHLRNPLQGNDGPRPGKAAIQATPIPRRGPYERAQQTTIGGRGGTNRGRGRGGQLSGASRTQQPQEPNEKRNVPSRPPRN
jgi:hypothetical protein